MERQVVQASAAPAAIGPYSQAVRAGGLLFVSGQIPLDPETGALVADDIRAATRLVLRNLAAVLEAGGAGLADVVKTTIYVRSMADFAVVNEVYGSVFGEAPPARACVEVSALPKGAPVEIEAVALATGKA
jgi:2-iminobutanoate/2-iminopropanoate deaminase